MLDKLFDNLDETLFNAVNSASDQKEQNYYFSCMEELRTKRNHSHTRFRHYLTQNFRALVKSEKQLWKSSIIDLYGIQDFEIEVSINNIVTRTRCAIPGPLLYLLTRLNALLPEARVISSSNPFDPKQIVTAFILAVAPLKFDTSLRLQLLNNFEKVLLETLQTQVELANALLIQKNYCPDIDSESLRHTRFTVPEQVILSSESSTPEPSRKKSEPSLEFTNKDTASQIPAIDKTAVHTTVQTTYPSISKSKLFHLIDFMQRCQLRYPLSLSALQVQPLIEHLLTNSIVRYERHTLSNNDKNIIRLMDNAFRFVYSQELPQPMLLLVLKLQLPLLKVALCDTRFLTNRNHPARQLLNALTTTGINWEQTNSNMLHNGIHFIVERLSSELYGDPRLFQQLATSLINALATQTDKANKLEVRVIESEQGKDKTEHARLLVNQLLADRLQGKKIHPQCKTFLLETWYKILFQQVLKYGENSEKVKNTLLITQHFIHLSSGMMANNTPIFSQLIDPIRERLYDIHTGQKQIDQQLIQLQTAIQQTATEASQGTLAFPIFDQTYQEPTTIVDFLSQKDLENLDTVLFSDLLKQVEQLTPGTWFQFTCPGQPKQLCKLASQLPFSNSLLFTHANGQKAKTVSLEQLASQLYRTEATPVHNAPLLDRALRYATNQLRSEMATQIAY
ncbi:hypothetical protein A9Q81_22925 [Gammaproteobacteria bacterium 42_54_T18]|nr:hypothetical protein A9Q81_22925 [Gammaproteobacteria bacterium 42_54_T18]